jgi:hypothetical protein
MGQKASVFVRGRPFHPNLMFLNKDVTYLKSSTLWEAPVVTHKHLTMLERSAGDKHLSLLVTFVSYKENAVL